MRKSKPLTDDDGEVRELLLDDMKQFRPIAEVLSESSLKKIGLRRPKPASQPKESVTLQLSQDVLDRFRATGRAWESRVDGALREWLTRHAAE